MQGDSDKLKFSLLQGKATCPLLPECCVAVYEYFITAGLGPLIQFRLPISTLHLTVCCYLFLLCCDVFIYLKWMVPLCLTLPTLLLPFVVLQCLQVPVSYPAVEGATCQESLGTLWNGVRCLIVPRTS